MTVPSQWEDQIRVAVGMSANMIVAGEYDQVTRIMAGSALSDADLRAIVLSYPHTLIEPSSRALAHLEVQTVAGAEPPEFDVLFPLPTIECDVPRLLLQLRLRVAFGGRGLAGQILGLISEGAG